MKNAPKAWDADHYADWKREDLVWRILFLQDAGRWWWTRHQNVTRTVLPVAVFASLVAGMLVGLFGGGR